MKVFSFLIASLIVAGGLANTARAEVGQPPPEPAYRYSSNVLENLNNSTDGIVVEEGVKDVIRVGEISLPWINVVLSHPEKQTRGVVYGAMKALDTIGGITTQKFNEFIKPAAVANIKAISWSQSSDPVPQHARDIVRKFNL